MKPIVFIFLFAGLGLFAPAGLYAQRSLENSKIKKQAEAAAAKDRASDPFSRLAHRRTNRSTSEYIHTITVYALSGTGYTFYYAENETGAYSRDLADFRKNYADFKITPHQKVKNPNYRGGNQANNDWNANASFSNNEMENAEINIFDLPSARDNAVATINNALPEIALNFDNMGDYLPKNEVVIMDISGRSIIEGQLSNQPALSAPDYSGLAKGKAEMEKLMEKSQKQKEEELKLWTDMYSSIGNKQRFATIIGFMNEANDGQLPQFVLAGEKYFVFVGDNQSMYIVAKDGSTVSYTDQKGVGLGGSATGEAFGLASGSYDFRDKDFSVSAGMEGGYNPKSKEFESDESGISFYGGVEGHYHILSGHSVEYSIGENGVISGYSTALSVGPGIYGKGGYDFTSQSFGLEGGLSAAKIEAKTNSAFPPAMTINKDGSVNFSQSGGGIGISAEAGVKVSTEIGKKGVKVKLGPIGLEFTVANYDINGAVKQLPPGIATQMKKEFAQDNNAIHTQKQIRMSNPNPQHNYDITIWKDDPVEVSRFLNNLSNE